MVFSDCFYPKVYILTNTWIVLIVLKKSKVPPIESFYSELTLSGVSKNDYTHAQKIYEALECRDLGDYHDAYMCSDVFLLADVF